MGQPEKRDFHEGWEGVAVNGGRILVATKTIADSSERPYGAAGEVARKNRINFWGKITLVHHLQHRTRESACKGIVLRNVVNDRGSTVFER